VSLLPDTDTDLIPDPPDDDDDELSTPASAALAVRKSVYPPDVAADAVRDAAAWVEAELVRHRAERERINGLIRDLVTEQDRLKRLVRVLDAT
jgi:hypothetical protein